MNRMIPLALAAVVLLVACQDLDDPTAPALPSDPAAARASGRLLAAPSNTQAVAVSESQVDIVWQDNSRNETGFEVFRSIDGRDLPPASTAANAVAYTDTLLYEPGPQYCYRVRAVRVSANNNVSYSEFSNIACVTTLAAPSGTKATSVSENQVDISWQDNSSYEDRFEVQRSTTGETGSFTLLTLTAANALAHTDTGVASGTQYCYRVRAVRNGFYYSAFSNTTCATTPGSPPPPPDAASGTTVRPSGSQVFVSWTDNSTNEDGFRINRSTDGGAVWDLAGTTANVWFYEDGRQSEQTVCYRVIAFNVTGDSSPSNQACTTPPAGPTNLIATRIDAQTVELNWTDNSGVEDGYQVSLWQMYYSCDSGSLETYIQGPVADLPANSTSYVYSPSPVILTCDWGEFSTYDVFYVAARKDGGSSLGAEVEGPL